MAQQNIVIGAANAGTGDTYFDAFTKAEANFTELYGLIESGSRVIVSELADFPTPAGGIITLAANTQYFLTENVALGSNRIVFSANSAISSIDSIVIMLSYSGTGDMFTFNDVTARINNISIDAPNGRLFNWTDTSFQFFRVSDVTIISCDKIGRFNGSNSVVRFTNVSPNSVASDGCEFLGNFRAFLWEVSAGAIDAGSYLKLGTATFDSFLTNTLLVTLNGSSVLLDGATGSANINTGGSGVIYLSLTSGTGTPLSGITTGDALWEFRSNDDIADTRSDALISMQGNATETVITATDTPVLVAGTWVSVMVSQMTASVAGRATYVGGKDARLPITYSISLEPASGTNIKMSAYAAIDGVVVPGSKREGTASSGSPTSITIPWQYTFSTNTHTEVFVENNDTTANILVSSAISRIN